ncbi:MAG: DUF262 domain-containing protein [Muribaculaceae bacterium]|nr:DUF262 domain-containing protein [Muribaculaceae bacterium]
MADNQIGLKTIRDLLGMKFFVPSYQRGYKWRAKDVEYLIDDIAEIKDDDSSDYCLQPIVVAPKSPHMVCPMCGQNIDASEKEYILVDGQQRLTTIWLIANWAKHNGVDNCVRYDITYDTREDSNKYLANVRKSGESLQGKDTCDTHYFSEAISAIKSKKDKLVTFFNNVEKNVKIIWYEIDQNEGPAHFERLNNAKISLTNAELVKAFILTKTTSNSQMRIACEWDEMEYKLQDKSFFSFITSKDSIYNKDSNRIELLLDLYVGTKRNDKEKDEHHTFNQIVQKVEKEGKNVKEIWQDILNIYNRLLCWYNDNFLYNLLGFLVEDAEVDDELPEIWKECDGKSMKESKEIVRNRVINSTPSDDEIRNMVYKDKKTKNVLLLFNILSLLSIDDQIDYKYFFNDKFHFDLYKDECWDKEHVHATASESLQSKVDWVNWLKDLDIKLVEERLSASVELKNEYLEWIRKAKLVKNEDYSDIKDDKNETFKTLSKEKFSKLFQEIVSAIEGVEDDRDFKQNSIGNLVLLNAGINRSGAYKVAPFSTKRKIIMNRVKNGRFVPLGTQNVFMKVYTPIPGHFYKWEKDENYNGNEKSDRDHYIDTILETINRLKK